MIMAWVVSVIVFLGALGFFAGRRGGRYAVGIGIFLLLTAFIFELVRRNWGERDALVFSLIALGFAIIHRLWKRSGD